jgi:hypothetical protein
MKEGVALYMVGLLLIGCLVVVGQGKHIIAVVLFMFLQLAHHRLSKMLPFNHMRTIYILVYNVFLKSCTP